MPITATSSNPITDTSDLAAVNIDSNEVPMRVKKDAIPLNTKMRSYTLTANQSTNISIVFQDDHGNPYDLTDFSSSQFKAYISESATRGEPIELAASIADASAGKLTLEVTKEKAVAGVYRGLLYCVSPTDDKAVIRENPFMLYIAAGMLGRTSGPPSILEIRLQLRDSSPEENALLDGYNFTDEEIALAVTRPVTYFNESMPRTNTIYTTHTFPWRYHWIEGAIAQLYLIVAEGNRKNNLQYSAGGVSVNDNSKEQNYMQAYQLHWQTFLEFVKAQKVKENMDSGWCTVGSWYGRRY